MTKITLQDIRERFSKKANKVVFQTLLAKSSDCADLYLQVVLQKNKVSRSDSYQFNLVTLTLDKNLNIKRVKAGDQDQQKELSSYFSKKSISINSLEDTRVMKYLGNGNGTVIIAEFIKGKLKIYDKNNFKNVLSYPSLAKKPYKNAYLYDEFAKILKNSKIKDTSTVGKLESFDIKRGYNEYICIRANIRINILNIIVVLMDRMDKVKPTYELVFHVDNGKKLWHGFGYHHSQSFSHKSEQDILALLSKTIETEEFDFDTPRIESKKYRY